MNTLTLQPAEAESVDCSITSGASDAPYDTSFLLAGTLIGFGGPGAYYRSLFRFDLTGVPANALVVSASLTLTHAGGAILGTPTFYCDLLARTDFTEAATWLSYDGANAWETPGADVLPYGREVIELGSPNGNVVFGGLRDALQLGLDSGQDAVGLRWSGPEVPGADNYKAVYSAAADPEKRPKLVVQYIDMSSTHHALLGAVRQEIVGLCDGQQLPGIASVLDRLVPIAKDIGTALDKPYKLPAVLIFPGANERFAPAMNDSQDVGYPVVVAIIEETAGAAQVNVDRGRFLFWRERIIHQFVSRYLAISSPDAVFHDCLVEPGPIVDWNKWGEGLRVGSFTLRFVIRKTNRH